MPNRVTRGLGILPGILRAGFHSLRLREACLSCIPGPGFRFRAELQGFSFGTQRGVFSAAAVHQCSAVLAYSWFIVNFNCRGPNPNDHSN